MIETASALIRPDPSATNSTRTADVRGGINPFVTKRQRELKVIDQP
jgi:hypothetical protein